MFHYGRELKNFLRGGNRYNGMEIIMNLEYREVERGSGWKIECSKNKVRSLYKLIWGYFGYPESIEVRR